MHLSRDVLKQNIVDKGIVKGDSDINEQLTANGFDVSLAALIEILEGGTLAIKKENNKQPVLGKAWVLQGYEHRLKDYSLTEINAAEQLVIDLDPLKPYFAITCEEVNTPEDMMFHIEARTSLFRFTQSLLMRTVGEAGYKGFLVFILLPFLKSRIELGTRFAQLIFTELKGKANYEQQKNFNHQGGKLF